MTKREHTFRQSWLKEVTLCPERARRTLAGTMPERETDAAAIGTAVHAGIEATLLGKAEDYGHANAIAYAEFEKIEAHPAFTWTKYSHRVAQDRINTYLAHWWGIKDMFRPIDVEWSFNKVLWEDDDRIIRVSGTIDLVDERLGLIDWKTSGNGAYETWEYDRWAIQPTVYTFARHDPLQPQHPFTYNVMHKDGIQTFTVWRNERDWNWLVQRAIQLAKMIEADLDEWSMHDNHALCSAKWCPAWDTCKGAYYYS